jgi:ERF superfamily
MESQEWTAERGTLSSQGRDERDALVQEQARDLGRAVAPRVYSAICGVISDLSKVGIAKDKRNIQQGYQFRGIDDVYGALSPLLAKHQLCILPRVVEREVTERPTKSGGVQFYTTLKVAFDFVSALDGSTHAIVTVGEAMDSGDKSSNKALSAAYKYACFQAFCIPVEGDNDADATTPPEVIDEVDATEAVARAGVPPERVNAWLKRVFGNTTDVRRLKRAHFTVLANKLPEFARAIANEAMQEGREESV